MDGTSPENSGVLHVTETGLLKSRRLERPYRRRSWKCLAVNLHRMLAQVPVKGRIEDDKATEEVGQRRERSVNLDREEAIALGIGPEQRSLLNFRDIDLPGL